MLPGVEASDCVHPAQLRPDAYKAKILSLWCSCNRPRSSELGNTSKFNMWVDLRDPLGS